SSPPASRPPRVASALLLPPLRSLTVAKAPSPGRAYPVVSTHKFIYAGRPESSFHLISHQGDSHPQPQGLYHGKGIAR
ncbi:hypothetical protein OFN52_33345, partial [Escherichia coli]|nr:hypothetical protein [Escherichia coli]